VVGHIVRPLIESSREQIEAYLRERSQAWRTDETNFDTEYTRNRLRHVVIPGLIEKFNPNLRETLARTVEILESEDEWMQTVTERTLADLTGLSTSIPVAEEVLALDSAKLAWEPVGLIRRVIREAARRIGSDLRDVTFGHIEATRGLLEPGKSGKFVQLPSGFEVAREFQKLIFRRAGPRTAEYQYELRIPGEIHIPEIGRIFRAEIVGKEGNQKRAKSVLVDADAIGPCVIIRNWKPGDFYKPVGLPAGKLKKLFQRARVPRSHRSKWPVVVADSRIVWVASFPVSREFVPGGRSQSLVVIEERESKGFGP
jgi:tRNA(Ile)-lysidine synthase